MIEPKIKYKVAVACSNANGESDFFFCIVECTEDDYEAGIHYDVAKEKAEENGYESPFVVFDKNDAGNVILEHCVWESVSTYQPPEMTEAEKDGE